MKMYILVDIDLLSTKASDCCNFSSSSANMNACSLSSDEYGCASTSEKPATIVAIDNVKGNYSNMTIDR